MHLTVDQRQFVMTFTDLNTVEQIVPNTARNSAASQRPCGAGIRD
jgi:hypothetical protein